MILTVSTKPFANQKLGTSGLRKKTKEMMQPNYLENFVQSIFNTVGPMDGKTLVLGGDGRFFNDIAIQKILKMAAANNVKKIIVGQNGILSTPATSNIIIKYKTDGGIILSASHNPAGINGDVGIKFNSSNGGSAKNSICDAIYEETTKISEYKILQHDDVALDQIKTFNLGEMEVEVISSVLDYEQMLETLFDFEAIKNLFKNGFTMKFDAMHAVTGPYAKYIFEDVLGAAKGSVINAVPKPDFGGGHPEPNLTYAKELLKIMFSENAPDFGAASDGDGDRNMILGNNIFIAPSDSLAIITDNFRNIPAYKNGIFGVAKSMSTSMAAINVAKALGLPSYETPTGWKYFGNLMDAKLITFCGEESYGTGSNHIREKDGIWAILCWLNIIAATGKSVKQIAQDHWKKYGRNYYAIHSYEEINQQIADKMMADFEEKLPSLVGKSFGNYVIAKAEPFVYNDPVDKTSTKNGLRVIFENASRIVCRLSGTGTSGATLRLYLERYEEDKIDEDNNKMLCELQKIANEIIEIEQRTGKAKADVVA